MAKLTRQIFVGGVPVGGGAPVTVQSMTNTDTANAEATAAQINALTAAGCEIVRSSVYNMACAKALSDIKSKISIPLVADIHFDYRLAIAAIENGAETPPKALPGQAAIIALTVRADLNIVRMRPVEGRGRTLERQIN